MVSTPTEDPMFCCTLFSTFRGVDILKIIRRTQKLASGCHSIVSVVWLIDDLFKLIGVYKTTVLSVRIRKRSVTKFKHEYSPVHKNNELWKLQIVVFLENFEYRKTKNNLSLFFNDAKDEFV